MGAHRRRVEDPAELASALKEAIETPGPRVVDVVVTRDVARMLPGVDKRAKSNRSDNRIA
ncbi:hypothetical protein [Pseudonocardia thermophila]|mgnify:CR=1 FL=1|uniref:hypothetical protein n=1 Tax=Pseudonocardia thermophila TaxID=1848 RepID=UPI00248E7974|nr:hypothetical protein [Pseudonocardia thermophila]